jgi:hypothetical protein
MLNDAWFLRLLTMQVATMAEEQMDVCEENDPLNYREEFLSLLDDGEDPGKFAVGGEWKEAPVPGLTVEGIDDVVGVPLNSFMIAELSKVCI